MNEEGTEPATSTEITGGAGFTYEDAVVAYYLAALLREDRAAPIEGIVRDVAVQQAGHGHPMDDIVIGFENAGVPANLNLQVKRKIQISASNNDFADILARAVATRASGSFNPEHDSYGLAVEHVAAGRFRTFRRLIDWAQASPTGEHFAARFAPGGSAASAERKMRDELSSSLKATSPQDERDFYARFVALKLDGLTEGAPLRTEVVNRLQELVESDEDGQDVLLFDRLCRIARDGAGTARRWTRGSLLAQLRGTVRLKVAPSYQQDINVLAEFSRAGMEEVSEEIIGFRVDRPDLESKIREKLTQTRLVNLTGLPGCGKSAMLKRIASQDRVKGPILFLKSDRLEGKSWLTFANALNLEHTAIGDLLAEIGATGTPVLFIDGVDRVRPDQRGVINDILRSIESEERLTNWRVLATSRDQGLEPYRTWFSSSFYRGTGIGDVPILPFTDDEAYALANKMPSLRRLLFGAAGVREIARRPFFAAVLARSFPDGTPSPQTEIDLIKAWWDRAGHDAPEEAIPLRQRALLDLALQGVRNLGKNIPSRFLKDRTFVQVPGLKTDLVIRDHEGGASFSFTHDIFFEWVFYRHLIELGDEWKNALLEAGEPPLLGRVVGLLAQSMLGTQGRWSRGYRELEAGSLRPQWRREWLTAPPFSPSFAQGQQEFQALLLENDFALLEKLLVWFQAQHTIPNPHVLQNAFATIEGIDRVRMADLLGWPTDFESWGRLLDWLLPLAISLPPRLVTHVLEVFGVWQNACADIRNDRSANIVEVASSWLVDLETVEYPEELTLEDGRWEGLGGEARKTLATSLRVIVMRSARAYPGPATALFERAVANERMRNAAYGDLMGFTPTMVDVSADAIIAVAKAEILEELPQDKADREEREHRERIEWIKRIRAIPENKRTESEQRALDYPFYPIDRDNYDLDDAGVVAHHSYYSPPCALHEPFATLLEKKPEVGLGLVRDIANHATKAWHQVQLIDCRRRGTPLPVRFKFPWGEQEFWGDWHVYNWFMGQLGPQPLESAFLALSFWAFKQIEVGRPTDEVVRSVVEGSQCYASLGLALVLALETYDVSETTFPIVTCQRLWEHDIARVAQEPLRNVDLMGVRSMVLSKLSGQQVKAQEFLESRASRKRIVRELVMRFALSGDAALRARFKAALAAFPDDLPYELEEARSNPDVAAALKEKAEGWAGLGDIRNYRKQAIATNEYVLRYNPPDALTPAQEERLKDATASFEEQAVIGWAMNSLKDNALDAFMTLDAAIAFARLRESPGILDERMDVGKHTPQTTLSAVAAAAIRFGPPAGPDYDWAWGVMERVARMREPKDHFSGSRIPWHPANHLIAALAHDRRSPTPRNDLARALLQLTAHPIEGVEQLAFSALFADRDEHIRWVAAQLTIDRSFYYRSEMSADGQRDDAVGREAREASMAQALERLDQSGDTPLPEIPPAWVKAKRTGRSRQSEDGTVWDDADPSFDAKFASKLLSLVPIEAWCESAIYRPMFAKTLKELCAWTAERLMPSWQTERRRRLDRTGTRLTEWNHVLGDVLARAAPFFDAEEVRRDFLNRFLVNDEEGLNVLAPFIHMTVIRHVIDAARILDNTFELLGDAVDRVIADPVFRPGATAPAKCTAGKCQSLFARCYS